jgi:transcriptional regulator with XRE-family HTH domain
MPRDPLISPIARYIKEQLAAKKRLEGRQWSQNHLARKSGLSAGGLSMILSGKVEPKAESLANIAKALDIDSKEILKVAGLIEKEDHTYDPILLESMKKIDKLPNYARNAAIALVKQVADSFETIV